MKPVLVSTGEPAGIGPDICLMLANFDLPVVILGDLDVLAQRAKMLKYDVEFIIHEPAKAPCFSPQKLTVLPYPCITPVQAGQLNTANSQYVINLLRFAVEQCLEGQFSSLVTAPVHKGIINKANIAFTGHTEFLAEYCHVEHVVMMLACEMMKVALVTTHLPLRSVPDAINRDLIIKTVLQLHQALEKDFNIKRPRIFVAGLNPHAGEDGYLGSEEIEIIKPALTYLQEQGLQVSGPYPADTLFTSQHLKNCDAFLAMYHDQGLPVLKYAGFNQAVNITLGLPIIRTSVDHGTALELAGTGLADPASLLAAVNMALSIAKIKAGH